jgi:hypothetical protein
MILVTWVVGVATVATVAAGKDGSMLGQRMTGACQHLINQTQTSVNETQQGTSQTRDRPGAAAS